MGKNIYLLLIVIFIYDLCLADIIILKDGKKIEGEIITEAPDQIGIKTEKKFFYILKEKIEKVIIENKQNKEETNWVIVWSATGLIITFILIFLLAKVGNVY